MANCKSFRMLNIKEKIEFIGKLNHAVQNDEHAFQMGCHVINFAQDCGIYDGTTINPSLMGERGYLTKPK
jgi:hypothetical protein